MDLEARREDVVREHMDSENRLDFDATLKTFAHPRYELIGLDRVFDGPDEVMEYFRTSREPFPDQRNELIALHHTDDAVITEFWLMGTHVDSGKTFRERMCAFFVFQPGGDGIVCERVYFNPGSILAQIS